MLPCSSTYIRQALTGTREVTGSETRATARQKEPCRGKRACCGLQRTDVGAVRGKDRPCCSDFDDCALSNSRSTWSRPGKDGTGEPKSRDGTSQIHQQSLALPLFIPVHSHYHATVYSSLTPSAASRRRPPAGIQLSLRLRVSLPPLLQHGHARLGHRQ